MQNLSHGRSRHISSWINLAMYVCKVYGNPAVCVCVCVCVGGGGHKKMHKVTGQPENETNPMKIV